MSSLKIIWIHSVFKYVKYLSKKHTQYISKKTLWFRLLINDFSLSQSLRIKYWKLEKPCEIFFEECLNYCLFVERSFLLKYLKQECILILLVLTVYHRFSFSCTSLCFTDLRLIYLWKNWFSQVFFEGEKTN